MSLTLSQCEALALLASEPNEDNDGEMVVDKGQEWIGLRRFRAGTANALLRLLLLRKESEDRDGFQRYTISGLGRLLVARKITEADIQAAIDRGEPFSYDDNGIKPLDENGGGTL